MESLSQFGVSGSSRAETDTDLASLRLEALGLCLDVDADVGEAVFGPADGGAMEVREPPSLHLVPDDGDVLRELARELAEAGDGEEEVLERVERVVFGRRTVREGECIGVR